MLCAGCYDQWLRDKPIGVGAACQCCGDRRRLHLRFFELQRSFVVLCHNCTARAQAMPAQRSAEALLERLGRERRQRDRRRGEHAPAGTERRRVTDRRVGARDLFDATELAVEEAAEPFADGEVTRIHRLV